MLFNPTNIDIDRDGRLWVAEGVNYRSHYDRQPAGDRIVVLEDTDGDGRRQELGICAGTVSPPPMGIAVLDNKIVVSMTPDIVVYTDVNRDLKFDPAVDRREVILTGITGANTITPALRDMRPGRPMVLERRQSRRDVHRQVGEDSHRLPR